MRQIFLYLFLLFNLLIGISSCKTETSSLLPQPITDTIPIEIPFSTFHIPISYPISELEQFLNEKIQGKFFETTIAPTKNEKDQVKVEMTKNARIEISSNNGKLICKVPLMVKGSITNSQVNFLTKGIKPVETELILILETPADLDKDWRLVTRFELTNIKWVKPPVVKIAGINFQLETKLDAYLQQNKGQLTDLLDRELHKAVSLEKAVGKIWLDLQKPMIVVKKPPQAFIRFICHSISGDFKIRGDDLVCFTTIKTQVAMVAKTEMKVERNELPRFKLVTQNSSMSDVHVYAFAGFAQLNNELGDKLIGKEFITDEFSTTIRNVRVYASDSGLTVLMDAKGDIDATIAATVNPRFDSVLQTFLMENFQFQIVSDNALVNLGNAVLYDRVRDTVQTYLAIEMDTLIRKLPAIITGAINKGKTGRAIDVDISKLKILSCQIALGSKRLHFIVHTQLTSEIEVKQINAGKRVRIKAKKKAGS